MSEDWIGRAGWGLGRLFLLMDLPEGSKVRGGPGKAGGNKGRRAGLWKAQTVLLCTMTTLAGPVSEGLALPNPGETGQSATVSPPAGPDRETDSVDKAVRAVMERLEPQIQDLLHIINRQQEEIEALKRGLNACFVSGRNAGIAVAPLTSGGVAPVEGPSDGREVASAGVAAKSLAGTTPNAPNAPEAVAQAQAGSRQGILAELEQLERRFVFFGDLRERWQSDFHRRNQDSSRNRARTRLRLGFNYQIEHDLQFGFRVRTGVPDDPRSPHQSFGNVFDSWEFTVDRAYLRFTPGGALFDRRFSLFLGKFPNPFVTTEGFWDDDVSPEGVAVEIGFADAGPLGSLKIRGAEYVIEERNRGEDARMTGVQLQVDRPVSARNQVTLAVSLYDFSGLNSIAQSSSDRRENLQVDSHFASDFRVVDTILKADLFLSDLLISPFVDIFHNSRAVNSDRTGFWAGVNLGSPRKKGEWGFTYLFGNVEREATVAAFTQDDFQAGTGYRGHRIQFLYNVVDHVQFRPELYTTRRLNSAAGQEKKTEFTFRLNTEIKF